MGVCTLLLSAPDSQDAIRCRLRHAHRSCHRVIDFDEFVQSVLLRAVERASAFQGETQQQLIGWLGSIARRHAVTLLRRSPRVPEESQLADIAISGRSLLDALGTAEDEEAELRWLASVLGELDGWEFELLQRYYWGEESLDAIALDFKISANTLAQRHRRLLQRLRRLSRK